MPLAITVPTPAGVNVTLQLDVVVLTLAKVHGDPVNEPAAVPPFVNATVPPGAEAVPLAVSFTNPVQVIACETTTATGVQVTAVDVVLPPTVTVLLMLGPLPACAASDDV